MKVWGKDVAAHASKFVAAPPAVVTSSRQPARRVLVMTRQRSGSTSLMALLNQHK